MKIGLKLYSTNVASISDVRELKEKEYFNFVELYVIPGSYGNTIEHWKSFDVPYIIHAPHWGHGFNLAQINRWETNYQKFVEVRLFADILGANYIIVHGGNNGSFDETLRQIVMLDDKRIILENKPKIGLNNEVCVGWSPAEFQKAQDTNIVTGTALDFGHASCAARSSNINITEMIDNFMRFNPKVFHLSDGDSSSEKDIHLNLGKGNLDIAKFISFLPEGGLLTLETPRSPLNGLRDFMEDVHFVREVLS